MAVIEFISEDYIAEARENVTEQFVDKIVIDKYLQLLIKQQEALQKVFKDLLQKRSIEEATGAQLDIIGEIVGQPRELLSADLFPFFGFQGAPLAGSMGDLSNPMLGEKWYSFGQPIGASILMDDDTYRLFIKAKILKNNTASTPEEFLSFMNFMFGTTNTMYLAEDAASYTILFGRELSTLEQVLLNYVSTNNGYASRLIPKTVGVRVNFGYFQAGNYFGFQGSPGALGFGNLTGNYGYGLGYGVAYGDSDFGKQPVWSNRYDGKSEYNEQTLYSSEIIGLEPSTRGGIFATLL